MLLSSLGIEKGGTMTHWIVVRTMNFNENRYSDMYVGQIKNTCRYVHPSVRLLIMYLFL